MIFTQVTGTKEVGPNSPEAYFWDGNHCITMITRIVSAIFFTLCTTYLNQKWTVVTPSSNSSPSISDLLTDQEHK